MNLVKAAAVIVLWQSGRFDTHDIATALGCTEADVVRLIDAARNRERGPDLFLAHGGTA